MIDDSEQMLREFERRIDEQLVQAERLKTEMEQVRATAHGCDGAVEVTVDSTGGLADLHLGQAAMRLGPAELAGEILATARRAQAQLADKVSQTMAGVLGAGSETAEFVTRAYTERFTPPGDEQAEDRRPW